MRTQYIKEVLMAIIVTLAPFQLLSQTFFTRTGEVSFHASTPLENIDANTNEATCIINMETGEIAFAVLMKSFQFRKSLMQEHFNENYVESSKYPKGTFKGKIANPKLIVLDKGGSYPAEVEGEMTIHGVTRKIKAKGTIKVEFDPAGKSGQQAKQVTIRANTQPNITTLTIKTNILGSPQDAAQGPVRTN